MHKYGQNSNDIKKNVLKEERAKIRTLSGVRRSHQYERYLGLPPIIGRSKRRAFSKIKENLWQQLQFWKGCLLSQGEREVLLKAVALALPTFTMSVFKLSITLCIELESLIAQFWWRQNFENDKTHWIS